MKETIWTRGLQLHTEVTELKSFLGLFNEFRRSVQNFTHVAALLNCQFQIHQAFEFGRLNETVIEALETLQNGLLTPPKLVLPRQNRPKTLDTDACDKQIGGILLQSQPEGPGKLVEYWSCPLNKSEMVYYTGYTDRVAVVWAIILLSLFSKNGALLPKRTTTHSDGY